ncbi:MAG TPA: penicillin-binding transpeptidase domain-containing protein [Fervidobacterium sp.]|nr:penicillin-binding transpeptidase domain-containing protein [Fervidobacterium sp.]
MYYNLEKLHHKSRIQRFELVYICVVVLSVLFSVRIWNNIHTDRYALKSKIPALRGNIYDYRGRLLATSELIYVGYLDVDYLKSVVGNAYRRDPNFIRMLNNFGLSGVIDKIDEKRIIRLGSFAKREEITKKIPAQYLRFVSIEPEEKRISLSNAALGFIIGRTDQRYGISGVEEVFDKLLRPVRDGVISINYSGIIGNKVDLIKVEPENGKNVYLTIDSSLQKTLYSIAEQLKEEKQATEVGILVMESETGKIRTALTTQSWPTYYMGYFEPGSTIKPFIFSAALELGLVATSTHFYCPGYIKPLEDSNLTIRDLETHKDIDFYNALVHSCNVVSVETTKMIIKKYGIEKLYEVMSSFGFGRLTGIELPGEIPGVLKTPDKWNRADWAYISIGQSIGVTPIQLLAAFNSIVNDGKYVVPTIDESREVSPKLLISTENANILKQMLLDVVQTGTGVNAKIDNIKILGKTGTAQKNNKKDVTALFVGQVELDKKYSILVWVDSPQSEKLSSIVAAPFFKKVVLAMKDFENKSNDEFVDYSIIPDFSGWNIKQLNDFVEKSGLKLRISGSGIYIDSFYIEESPEGTILNVVMSLRPKIVKTNAVTN